MGEGMCMLSFGDIKLAPAKKMLLLSLFELLKESPLDAISTKSIYEGVGIAPNSFYYHFQDKYDCASCLFRILIWQAMSQDSDPGFDAEHLFEGVADGESIHWELLTLGMGDGGDAGRPYSAWMEKYYPLWYTMGRFIRDNARVPFLNMYGSRAPGSPYCELRATWDLYFERIQEGLVFEDDRQRAFLNEALFSFFELYLYHFALNPDYDFQESDAKNLMVMRRGLYESALRCMDIRERGDG